MKRALVTLLATTLLVACGSPAEPPAGAGSEPQDVPAGSDSPVSVAPMPGGSDQGLGGRPQRVRPRPGMTDVRPVGWEKARQTPDGRHLRILYWSGVEPCNVLDHVDVAYEPERIIVTLYEGSDPEQKDVACIELALQKVVKVRLAEPVDGRAIVDGTD